ncbi:hypothetical protein D3C86_1590880 [compost metagenome]
MKVKCMFTVASGLNIWLCVIATIFIGSMIFASCFAGKSQTFSFSQEIIAYRINRFSRASFVSVEVLFRQAIKNRLTSCRFGSGSKVNSAAVFCVSSGVAFRIS